MIRHAGYCMLVMITNTKVLFATILKKTLPKIACDIGCRDGVQSMLRRHFLPRAEVWAFESNPINFSLMKRNRALQGARMQVFCEAISGSISCPEFAVEASS